MEIPEARKESPMDMSASLDGFTHISSEMSMSASFSTKSQYSQVVFHDLPDVWPTDGDMVCIYSLTDNVLPQYGDKIALFKVGWSMVSEYITFQRAPTDLTKRERLSVTFKAETLPKDDKEIYQLCYVTSGNIIAGASTAFCFHKPNENELIGIEDPFNPGLVIFKSRVACLQAELKKKIEANELLCIGHELLENNFSILKKELTKNEEEIRTQKQMLAELQEEKKETQNINAKLEEKVRVQQQKISDLIKEIDGQKKIYEELLDKKKQEYEKIHKDFVNLGNTNSEYVTRLELLNKQSNELLKLQSDWTIEKQELEERLNNSQIVERNQLIELDKLKDEVTRLKQAEEKQITKAINLLNEENKALKEEKDNMFQELMANKQKLFSVISALDCIEKDKAHWDQRTKEIVGLNQQLVAESEEREKANEFLGKLVNMNDIRLAETEKENKTLNVSLKQAQEELEKNKCELENLSQLLNSKDQMLQDHLNKITRLNRGGSPQISKDEEVNILNAQLQTLHSYHEICGERIEYLNSQLDSMQLQYENEIGVLSIENDQNKAKVKKLEIELSKKEATNSGHNLPDQMKNKSCESCSPDLIHKCNKLQEEKTSLCQDLVQVRHEKKELERVFQEVKEDNAVLKSRTKVLEYELGTLRSNNSQAPKLYSEAMLHQIELFNKNMPNIITNSFIAEQALLFKGNIEKEREEKLMLQRKVEDLLKSDTEMCQKLEEMTFKFKEASLQNSRASSLNSESDKLEKVSMEKQALEEQVIELRKHLMGTISMDLTKDLYLQIDNLKADNAMKDEKIISLEKMVEFLS